MGQSHINERGAHTTVIEGARGILKALRKIGVETAPGMIEGGVKAHGRSVKLKKLNAATLEMVVVVNSSKQTFKLYGKDQAGIAGIVSGMKAKGWNVQETIDLSPDRER
jgi:hypothetical protein